MTPRWPAKKALLAPDEVSLTAPIPWHAVSASWILFVSGLLSSGVALFAVNVWHTLEGSVGSGGKLVSPAPQAAWGLFADRAVYPHVYCGEAIGVLSQPGAQKTPATATAKPAIRLQFTRRRSVPSSPR